MTPVTLSYLLLLILTAFALGSFFKYLKQPPLIGYLLAGLLLGFFVSSGEIHAGVELMAEIGVMLLLFSLGLEFSFSRLQKNGRITLIGGTLQILLTMLLGTILISGFGFAFYQAFFMAAAFSLSSTAVVVKLMQEKGETETLPGEIMTGWLILQDLAVLPLMIILPIVGKQLFAGQISGMAFWEISKNIGVAAAFLTAVLFIGKQAVPFLIKKVALLNSRELLLVAVFTLALSGAALTSALGLSTALGAFLAGLLIAESVEQHAIFSEIRPLRDIFSLLFFATLGLLIPAGFIFTHFGQILGITTLILLVKFLIVTILVLYFGFHARTSLIVGVGLIEVGEFAFLLARTGLSTQVIDTTTYGMILSVALLSILLMPPLYLAAPSLYNRLRDLSKNNFRPLYTMFFAKYEHRDTLPELPFDDHVVICGYGRVGKYIGRALEMAGIPYVVVEYNRYKVHRLRTKGVTVIYGDPSDIDILDLAQVDKAKALIIAIPDFATQEQVIVHSLTLNSDIRIYCRTHQEEHQQLLKALGVTSIIQPEFEASLSITDKILKLFNQDAEDIEGKISRLKIEHGLG